jgi:uncharacterized protein YndB with AHSA1/START domain
MKITPVFHDTFTLNRSWAATPSRVFSAWSDLPLKRQWFAPPPGRWTEIRRTIEFHRGGREIHEGRFNDSGMTTLYEGRFHLIEDNARLVFSYDLHLSDTFHSVTLATLVLMPKGARTDVTYTEQIAFLDGNDGTAQRKEGTEFGFDRIEKLIANGEGPLA